MDPPKAPVVVADADAAARPKTLPASLALGKVGTPKPVLLLLLLVVVAVAAAVMGDLTVTGVEVGVAGAAEGVVLRTGLTMDVAETDAPF